jgi:CHAD domain-containing protein
MFGGQVACLKPKMSTHGGNCLRAHTVLIGTPAGKITMAYRFERDFATVQKGVRKVAVDLMDDVISCASAKGKDVHETVHATRKACKKLRALIRLVRPVFNDYRAENAAFRDAGRKFSFLRDSGVLIETYDSLLKCYKDEIDRSKFAPIRRHMTLRQKEQAGRDDIPDMLKEFCATMMEARKRANRWHISGDGFDSLDGGLSKSYKGARRAMSEASKEPTAEAVHEWRKRVKDHWYHARLLCCIWPKLMKAHCEVADRLGDTLGKHHDLEVFQQRLVEEDYGDPQVIEVLSALARRRQKVLEEEAFSIGARLLAESAASLTSRWKFYWDAWRENEPRGAALAA